VREAQRHAAGCGRCRKTLSLSLPLTPSLSRSLSPTRLLPQAPSLSTAPAAPHRN
jgi:hypothetical protein